MSVNARAAVRTGLFYFQGNTGFIKSKTSVQVGEKFDFPCKNDYVSLIKPFHCLYNCILTKNKLYNTRRSLEALEVLNVRSFTTTVPCVSGRCNLVVLFKVKRFLRLYLLINLNEFITLT